MFLVLVFAVLFAFGGNAFLFAGTPIKSEPHQRDPYNWAERHADVMAQNKKAFAKIYFLWRFDRPSLGRRAQKQASFGARAVGKRLAKNF